MPATSMPSGTSATSSATAPSPTPSWPASASRDAIGVRGNHDAAALGGPEIEWFNPEARAAVEWTRDTISADDPRVARALPERRVVETSRSSTAARATRCGSTSPTVPSPRTTSRSSRPGTASTATPTCPVAWTATPDRVALVQPGATDGARARRRPDPAQPGQRRPAAGRRPAGAPTSSSTRAGRVTWHRVAYDIAPVQAAMRAAGLPARLARAAGVSAHGGTAA